ncbi:MAG: regulator SirB [Burkholderiaceae bacterium]|nr:MAG: regulator SirB [Burkholderiaceae bacterium]TBR76477.1 MAG: regulator SirB [Burkholderiaceae bacterium]
MNYEAVKSLHVGCVALSISLFTLRAALQWQNVAWRRWRVLRIAPHVVDTVLLGSALWLCWIIGQYPFVQGWLTAKVLALAAYILLGRMALGRTAANGKRLAAFVAALCCVGYIVGVALTHSPTWGR